jgi:copper resistance protein C
VSVLVHTQRVGARFALVGLLLVGLLALAGPAWAHAVLLESEPGDGEAVEGAPDEIVLVFSEPMQAPATIVVRAPDGAPVDGDEAGEVDGERVWRSLAGVTADGAYTVEWRAVSADDHPISGELTFEVVDAAPEPTPEAAIPTPAAPSPTPSPTPEAAIADEPAAAEAETGGAGPVVWLLAGAVLVGVAATGLAMRAGRGQPSE